MDSTPRRKTQRFPNVTVSIGSSKDKVVIDSAPVLIGNQAISLAPLAATVAANTKIDLNATALDGLKGLIWQVNGVNKGNEGFGTIDNASDASAIYTAPKNTDTASSVTVTLLSADCKFSASTAIVIVQPSGAADKDKDKDKETAVEIVLNKDLYPYKKVNPRVSSIPLKPEEKIELAATLPDSKPISVVWTATVDPSNAGAAGQFDKPAGATTTYQAPPESKSALIPITITATPTMAGFKSASIKVFVMKQVLAHCNSVTGPTTPLPCTVTDFDRLKGGTGQFPSDTQTAKT